MEEEDWLSWCASALVALAAILVVLAALPLDLQRRRSSLRRRSVSLGASQVESLRRQQSESAGGQGQGHGGHYALLQEEDTAPDESEDLAKASQYQASCPARLKSWLQEAADSARAAKAEGETKLFPLKTLAARCAFVYDFGSDVYVSYHLFGTHPWWSFFTAFFAFLPFPVAAVILWPSVVVLAKEKLNVKSHALLGLLWLIFSTPCLLLWDIYLVMAYPCSEPVDPRIFHYMSLRKILEATVEGNFQVMLQGYMLLRLRNPFSLFPVVHHVPNVKPAMLCLSVLSSMNATREGFGYLSKFADLQANGSILRFIMIIRNLGVGHPPITLLHDLGKKSEVVVGAQEVSQLSLAGIRSISSVVRESTTLRSLTFQDAGFWEQHVTSNPGACFNSIQAIVSCPTLTHLCFGGCELPKYLHDGASQQLQRHSRLRTVQVPGSSVPELKNMFYDELPGLPPLLRAVWAQDLAQVQHELATGASAALADSSQRTAVHLAVWKGAECTGQGEHVGPLQLLVARQRYRAREILRELVLSEYGQEVLSRGDAVGMTPLHVAAEHGYEDSLALLGSKLDAADMWRRTPLCVAAIRGHVAVVKALLDQQADVDLPEENLQSPLFYAGQKGHMKVLEALLKARAWVDLPDRSGCTPLMMSAENGYLAAVRRLAAAKGDVNWQDSNHSTPLVMACLEWHVPIIEALLSLRADANCRSRGGDRPLHIACKRSGELVPRLIRHGSRVNTRNEQGWAALHFAVEHGHISAVESLARARADLKAKTQDGGSPVVTAIWHDKPEVLQVLLRLRADPSLPNNAGVYPLHFSAKKGDLAAARELLAQRVDVDCPLPDGGAKPLFIAVEAKFPEVSRVLLEARADVDGLLPNRFSTLLQAVRGADTACVELLLEFRADVQCSTEEDGLTPVSQAAENGNEEILKRMLESGATIEQAESAGWPPLVAALLQGHADLGAWLLDQGCSPHTRSKRERLSPLYAAAISGLTSTVEALLAKRVEVDAADSTGDRAPLFVAAEKGHGPIVSQLLRARAAVNRPSQQGQTVLHAAASGGHESIVAELLRARANVNSADSNGTMPILQAAGSGNEAAALSLLDARAEIQAKQQSESTLVAASQHPSSTLLQRLLNAKADPNKVGPDGRPALFVASGGGHVDNVRLLAKHRADLEMLTAKGATSIFFAAQTGHAEVVAALISLRANCNAVLPSKMNPLVLAIAQGHNAAAKALLDGRADILSKVQDGVTPLSLAAQQGKQSTLEMLVAQKADLNQAMDDGTSPIHVGVLKGHLVTVQLLLHFKAEPHSVAKNSSTPLVSALALGQVQAAQNLIEDRANVTGYPQGDTPLIVAVAKRKPHVIEMLLAARADANEDLSMDGRRALHLAIASSDQWLVASLLSSAADARAADVDGVAPLAMAAHFGQMTSCRLLLASEADPGVTLAPPGCGPGSGVLQALRSTTHLNSTATWVTFGAPSLSRTKGNFYYEVKLGPGAVSEPQIGWATSDFATLIEASVDGIGDDAHSWGCDGLRHMKWHAGNQACQWPEQWVEGGVVGCAVDLDIGKMEFFYNGVHCPAADFDFELEGDVPVYPAISLRGDFTCHFSSACVLYPCGRASLQGPDCAAEPRPRKIYGTPAEVAARAGHRELVQLLGEPSVCCGC